MTNILVKADNLIKKYGSLTAVNNISFEIVSGSLLAMLGPNGAGKTTTIEMLEGCLKPDGGKVAILDFDPFNANRLQIQQIGAVLQESQDEPFIKVKELLLQRARYYENPMRIDELLDLMELTDKSNSLIKNLSGGQRRKLEVALAILGNPRVIFLDEPTVGFDPAARRSFWDTIRSLKNDNRAIVLTTHYMDEAEYLADDIIVLSKGQIVASGSPEALKQKCTNSVQISFSKQNIIDVSALNYKFEIIDQRYSINTNHPTKVLNELTQLAVNSGVEIIGLEVRRPSLEDVFLELSD